MTAPRWHAGTEPVRRAVEAWLAGSLDGEVLRDNPRRRVVRLDPPDLTPLLVKHFRTGAHHRLRERFKAAIGRSPAAREARHLRALRAADVPVPAPLGEAVLPGGDRLLVLPFLEGAAGAQALATGRAARTAQLRALGEAVAAVHDAGYTHGDLHAGNVLFQQEGVVLLDLQHAHRTRSPARRLRDLGELDYSLWDRASLSDRMRVRLAALGAGDPGRSDAALRVRVRGVGEAAHAKAWRHGRSRTRRLLRKGRLATRVAHARGRGLRLRRFPAEDLDAALAAHEHALAEGGAAVLKDDARSRMTRVRAGERAVVVKEIPARSPWRALADAVRGSGAWRGWRGGHGLLVRGLGAATPLAILDQARFGVPTRSWLVLEDLAPALDLLAHPPERRAALVRRLGPWLDRLHRRGVDHGDLKATHVYVDPHDDGPPRLIDLEGVHFPARLTPPMRLQALAELNASLPDSWTADERLQVLRRYRLFHRLGARGAERAALEGLVERSLAREHRWTGADCATANARLR